MNVDEYVYINSISINFESPVLWFCKSTLTFLVPLSLSLLTSIAKPICPSLVMSCLQGICAFMLMPLPATFSVLVISVITLPFSICYPGQDITYFWTQSIKLPKCKNCQLWKVLKQHRLLALLKVKNLFLLKALGAGFYYRHESDSHTSLQGVREGRYPMSQEETPSRGTAAKNIKLLLHPNYPSILLLW